MNRLLVLFGVAAVLALTEGRSLRERKFGPKGTIIDFNVINCYEGQINYVADKNNLCWYWQCVANKQGVYDLVPRRCALGSKMPYSYKSGRTNPCLINFNTQIDFECTRTEDFVDFKEPECASTLKCFNNGTVKYEGNICWCDCLYEWSGASDCSLPPKEVEIETNLTRPDTCWKDNPPCDIANGCANGGICHNTCKDFWCDCPVPFTAGKRCERFDCQTTPCKNGGTCNRGLDDQDEVNSCSCPQGYSGLLCEHGNGPVTTAAPATVKAFTTAAPVVNKVVTTAAPVVNKVVTTAAPAATKVFTTAAPAATKVFTTAAPVVTKVFTTAAPVVNKVFTTAAPAATKVFTTAAPVVTKVFTTAAPVVNKVFTTVAPAATKVFTTAAPAATKVFTTAAPVVNKVFTTAAPAATKVFTTAAPAATKVFTTAAPVVNKVFTTAAPVTVAQTTAKAVVTTAAPKVTVAPATRAPATRAPATRAPVQTNKVPAKTGGSS